MKVLHADVLVVGGGTAGTTAASAAAEQGAKVVLAEIGCGIGGIGTHGGIHAYYMGVPPAWQKELDEQAKAVAEELRSKATGFHPEAKKLAVSERLASQGIHAIYNALAVEVVMEGCRVTGVVLETPEETVTVYAGVTIDSTSNGDVAALAGAAYEMGREWDGALHCYSLPPRIFNPEEGRLHFRNFDAGWVDVTSSRDISRAYLDGRRLVLPLDLNKYEMVSVSSLLGAREGRLIRGEYVLEIDDLILDRTFPDVVMTCYSHYDNHARDMANESRFAQYWVSLMGLWPLKLGGDVPYRCFVPESVDGLLIGCRALSMTHDASTALRMQPDMHAAGDVAGTAAALAVRAGVQPRAVSVSELQQRLIERGTLSREDVNRTARPWVTLNRDRREDGIWTESSVRQPERMETLLGELGTEQEGRALWWLWHIGPDALPMLASAYERAVGQQRIGCAIALALLGDAAGVPDLVRTVAGKDETMLCQASRVSPRWVQCLIALQALRHPGAAPYLGERLAAQAPEDHPRLPGYVRLQFMLHYLIEVAEQIPAETAGELADRVNALLADPELGEDWYNKQGAVVSNRWSTELTAALLLDRLGRHDAAAEIVDRYLSDRRGFAREAAARIRSRMSRAYDAKEASAR